jgi:hypothetical protein
VARRPQAIANPATDVAEIKTLLDHFLTTLPTGELREKVRSLIPAFHKLRDLGSSLVPLDRDSARDRIEYYLRKYPQILIDGDELLVVSGIGEWARRVRELRVQFGWWIYSGVTIKAFAEAESEEFEKRPALDDLRAMLGFDPVTVRPDQYILVSSEQDREAALRWNVLNGIRRQAGNVQDKILKYLQANVGKIVTGEELRYLAKDKTEWARRTRELRTEEGWPVYTKMQGRPDIPMGAYLLEEDKQAPPHDRKIKDDVRLEVLQRDEFKCTYCGWDISKVVPGDPRKFPEVHHIEQHAEGGSNTVENLLTLCNVHHDAVHRGELKWTGNGWVKISR